MKKTNPPHYKVYTRIMPSKIHGVGVFAIREIPKNINIFDDETEQNMDDFWIDKKKVEKFDPEIKKLYDDFCIIEKDKYSCPKTFNLLTVGWYINHSSNPNVKHNKNGSFTTLRYVKRGEEITVDYRTYSNEPPYKWLNNKLPKRKNGKIR